MAAPEAVKGRLSVAIAVRNLAGSGVAADCSVQVTVPAWSVPEAVRRHRQSPAGSGVAVDCSLQVKALPE